MDWENKTNGELLEAVQASTAERSSLEIVLADRLATALREVDMLNDLVVELQEVR